MHPFLLLYEVVHRALELARSLTWRDQKECRSSVRRLPIAMRLLNQIRNWGLGTSRFPAAMARTYLTALLCGRMGNGSSYILNRRC